MTEKLIDPDCAAGKCGSCTDGPCQHWCHDDVDAPITAMVPGTVERIRAAERQRNAARVRDLQCCGVPQMCDAQCRDDEESWAIAKAANPIADLIESEENQ